LAEDVESSGGSAADAEAARSEVGVEDAACGGYDAGRAIERRNCAALAASGSDGSGGIRRDDIGSGCLLGVPCGYSKQNEEDGLRKKARL
jgi:hypothetical protein